MRQLLEEIHSLAEGWDSKTQNTMDMTDMQYEQIFKLLVDDTED